MITASGGEALVAPADLRDEAAVDALAARVGDIDVLVANSGVAGPTRPAWEVEPDEWADTFAVNVTGTYLLCRAFVGSMVGRGSGSVVVVGSTTASRPLEGRAPYAASKSALVGLVRSLAASDAGPHGVRVNLVVPGPTDGDRLESVIARQAELRGGEADGIRERMRRATPLRRLPEGEDVADAVVFLASGEGSRDHRGRARRLGRSGHGMTDVETTPLAMFDARVAELGERPLLFAHDAPISATRLAALVDGLAGGLAGLGVARGDRVGLLLQNDPQFVVGDARLLAARRDRRALQPDAARARARPPSRRRRGDGPRRARRASPPRRGRRRAEHRDRDRRHDRSRRPARGPAHARPRRGHPRPPRARRRRRSAPGGERRPRRRRRAHLHLGDDRPTEGGDEHPREHRLRLAGLPRHVRLRTRRHDPRDRPALPRHRAVRPSRPVVRLRRADRARPPLRPGRGRPPGRAPSRLGDDRGDHRLRRAGRRPGDAAPRPQLAHARLQRRRPRSRRRSSPTSRPASASRSAPSTA